jgi:hypothetical protein
MSLARRTYVITSLRAEELVQPVDDIRLDPHKVLVEVPLVDDERVEDQNGVISQLVVMREAEFESSFNETRSQLCDGS